MFYVRYIDTDLSIQCEAWRTHLGECPKKAAAEVYTENYSRYLCREHLEEKREEYEESQEAKNE